MTIMPTSSNNGTELRSITETIVQSKAKVLSNEGIIAAITTIFIVTVAITIGILVIACNHGIGLGPLTGIGALGNTAAYSLLAGSAILLTVTTLTILVKLNNRVNHLAKEADDLGITDLQAQLEDAKETSARAETLLREMRENPSITVNDQAWTSENLIHFLEDHDRLSDSEKKIKTDLLQLSDKHSVLKNRIVQLTNELEKVKKALNESEMLYNELKQNPSITLNNQSWTAETLSDRLTLDHNTIKNLTEELEQVQSTHQKNKEKLEPTKKTQKKKSTSSSTHRSNNNSTNLYPNLTLEGNNFNSKQAKRTEKQYNLADKLNQACIYSSQKDADINLSGEAFNLYSLSFKTLSKEVRRKFESETGLKISQLNQLKEKIMDDIHNVQKEQNASMKNKKATTLLQKNKKLTGMLDLLSEYTPIENLFSKS